MVPELEKALLDTFRKNCPFYDHLIGKPGKGWGWVFGGDITVDQAHVDRYGEKIIMMHMLIQMKALALLLNRALLTGIEEIPWEYGLPVERPQAGTPGTLTIAVPPYSDEGRRILPVGEKNVTFYPDRIGSLTPLEFTQISPLYVRVEAYYTISQ